jgi:hypothetical protein
MTVPPAWVVDRRDFLEASAASLFGLWAFGTDAWARAAPAPAVRFGILTDSHYADADAKGTRVYRESIAKVREAVGRLRMDRVAFLAQLGDIKDMADGEPPERTQAHLAAITDETARFGGPVCHVLGNHDMDNLSKAEALARLRSTGVPAGQSHYAFSRGGVRFVALDACFTADGGPYDRGRFDWRDTQVPAAQLDWLRRELDAASEPVVVLAHQRLDGAGDLFVKNSADVRGVLEASGKVLAVFQGHDHPGARTRLSGIHYYTLKAVVEGSGPENNAYATVEVRGDLGITVTGHRRAETADLGRAASAAIARRAATASRSR